MHPAKFFSRIVNASALAFILFSVMTSTGWTFSFKFSSKSYNNFCALMFSRNIFPFNEFIPLEFNSEYKLYEVGTIVGNFIISKANSAKTSLFQLSNFIKLLLTYLLVLLSIFL